MKKKIRNRVAGVIISAILLFNSVPINEILPYISLPHWFDKSTFMEVKAENAPTTILDNTNSYNFNNLSDFINYCDYYKKYEDFAEKHKSDSITIAITSTNNTLTTDFVGLGSEKYPFEGSVTFGSTGSYTMSAYRAFFSYLSDKATIKGSDNNPFTLVLNRLSDVADGESTPILADYVVHNDNVETANLWQIQVEGNCTFSGAIGTIKENAIVNLNFTNNTNNDVISNAVDNENSDIGMFCGTLGVGAQLTVNHTGVINSAITSTNGNAGGLVGTMAENSTLNFIGLSNISPNVTANGNENIEKGYAGGLVGKLDSSATLQQQTVSENTIITKPNLSELSIGGNITGTSGAGGVFGYYKVVDTAGDSTVPEIDLNDYNVTAKSYGKYCGGLFGVLDTTGDMMITNTAESAKEYSSKTGDANESNYYYGGVAGKFTTNALTNTTTLSSMSIAPTACAKFSAFGGVFGIVDSVAYIKTNNDVSVSAKGSEISTTFGGLIGSTSTVSGVFIDLGDFTLNTNQQDFKGGGIVGQFNRPVRKPY